MSDFIAAGGKLPLADSLMCTHLTNKAQGALFVCHHSKILEHLSALTIGVEETPSSVPTSKASHCGESEEERDTIRLLSGK